MPTESSVEILPSELAQIVEVRIRDHDEPGSGRVRDAVVPQAGIGLTAAVHLAGDWNGAVLLECDRRQACRFAGRFLSMDPPDTRGRRRARRAGRTGQHDRRQYEVRDDAGDPTSPCPPWWMAATTACGSAGPRSGSGLPFNVPEGLFWVTVLTTKPSK